MTKQSFEYWKFNKVISPEDCKALISLGYKNWDNAVVGYKGEDENTTIRESEIFWIRDTKWKDMFWSFMDRANTDSGLNFQIDGIDHLQLTKYSAPSGHYNYHIDGNGYTEVNSKVRKLSMSCLLNDDFEGGDFNFRISKEYTVTMKQGDVLFFPSYFPHRVTPVTKGTRYSLVTWFVGEPLR